MSNEELSWTDSVNTTYQETNLPVEWDENALDTGEAVVEARSYHVLLISRTGNTVVQPTTSVSYRPRHSAAHGFKVTIEPDDTLHSEKFITGDAVLFADNEALQIGAIEKIQYNQNDEDYTVEARAVGYQIEEQSMNRQAVNEVVEDVLAKTVHEYNDVMGKHDDLFGTNRETTVNLETVGGDILTATDSSGHVDYSFDNFLAENLDTINFKAFVEEGEHMTVRVITPSETYSKNFDNLHKGDYGEWREFLIPGLPPEGFEIRFVLPDGGILYDWNALSELKVRTEVDPTNVQKVEEGVFAYHRSNNTLQNEVDEDSDGNPIVSPGVVWDDVDEHYRPRNVADWNIFTETHASNNSHIYVNDNACQGGEFRFEPGGATATLNFSLEEDARNWELHCRYRRDSLNTTDNTANWAVEVSVNGSTEQYGVPQPPSESEYAWQQFAAHDFFDSWTDNDSDPTIEIFTRSASDTAAYVDCFVLVDGPTFHTFDNSVNSTRGNLDSPYEYGAGYVQFTPGASSDNITSATTETDLTKVGEPTGRWGPRQRIDQAAPWAGARAPNSSLVENVFRYPGVNHQVRVHLAGQGEVRNDGTPRKGYRSAGMGLDEYTVSVDSDDLELFSDYNLNGNRLDVLSSAADESSHVFRWEGNKVQIFKQGQRTADVDLLQADTSSSVSDMDVYSSVEVIGDGVSSGVVEAPNPPGFVDRHKEIRDPDVTTKQDALRKASAFIVQNSTLKYSGDIRTLPTPVPVGERLAGHHFTHGQDLDIESASYSQRDTRIKAGFERRFSDQLIEYSNATSSEQKRNTQ